MISPEPYSLLPLNEWVTETPDGYRLNDPVSGDPLDPNQPPAFLAESHYRLRDGLDYLSHLCAERCVTVIYTNGERTADDLGTELVEPLLANAEMHGIQAVGFTVDGVVRNEQTGALELDPLRRTGYTDRIAELAGRASLPLLHMGVEFAYADGRYQPATKAERTLQAISDMAELQVHDETDRGPGKLALDAVSRNAYQWYRLLRGGDQMAREDMRWRAIGDELCKVVLLAPVTDVEYDRKLEALGVGRRRLAEPGFPDFAEHPDETAEAVPCDLVDQDRYDQDSAAMSDILERCLIPWKMLERS